MYHKKIDIVVFRDVLLVKSKYITIMNKNKRLKLDDQSSDEWSTSPPEPKNAKRLKLDDQLSNEWLTSPPENAKRVVPDGGYINFRVPSSSHPKTDHKVTVGTMSKTMEYKCTCSYYAKTLKSCKHIYYAISHMMTCLLEKQNNTDLTSNLISELKKFNISTEKRDEPYDIILSTVLKDIVLKDEMWHEMQ